jgi:hypothetical protein
VGDVQQFLNSYHGGEEYNDEAWSSYNPNIPRHYNTDAQSVASGSTTTWEEESTYTYASNSSRTHTARSASIFSGHSTAAQSSLGQSEAPPSQWGAYEVAGTDDLWCEFHQLKGCNAVFRLDKESAWIQHHISHLRNQFPSKLVCWFCNDPPFVAERSAERKANFVDRMQHIRRHISRDWETSDTMRPDFFMIEHMYQIRRIDQNMYETAMGYDEMPKKWAMTADAEPTSWKGAVCDNGEKERRQQRRNRRK